MNTKRKPELDPDDIQRTDWMGPEVDPTIPGMYACKTGGGHIFGRKWDGATWRSSIDGSPTTVRMAWRGIKPYSIDVLQYDAATRMIIMSQSTGDAILEAGAANTHYGMTREEFASRAGKSASCFENRLRPLCGNGSYHAFCTREKDKVDCPACKQRLAA